MAELTQDRKSQIEDIAYDIRTEYKLDINFDLVKFLTTYQSFEIRIQQIDDDTTGLILANDHENIENSNSNYVIIINRNLISDSYFEQKKRFICAHEYGHYVLHKGNNTKFARRDTKSKDTIEELEAEYFAYSFLMPKRMIDILFKNPEAKKLVDHIKETNGTSYADVIAAFFNVTPKKAHERLKQLELINV